MVHWKNFIMRGFSLLGEFTVGGSTVQRKKQQSEFHSSLEVTMLRITVSATACFTLEENYSVSYCMLYT